MSLDQFAAVSLFLRHGFRWLAGMFVLASVAVAHAGTIVFFGTAPEVQGKLTLTPAGIQVAGGAEIKLPDLLEANFSDAPFSLNYFSSSEISSQALPPDWKTQDIGKISVPGSAVFAAGEFTLNGAQWDGGDDGAEHNTVIGRPWAGDGQWTVRIKLIKEGFIRAGIMLRDNLEPHAANIGMGTWDNNNAFMFARQKQGGTWGTCFEAHDYPQWFRLTRRDANINFEFSNDGLQWINPGQSTTDVNASAWIGFYFPAHAGKADQKMVFDQVLFTPAPGLLLRSGILLRSGSFISGYFDPLDFLGPDPVGKFTRNGQTIPLASTLTCAAVYQPTSQRHVVEAAAQVGVLLRNNDFMLGEFEAINSGGVRLNSIAFGTTTFQRDELCAAVLHPLEPKPAPYEIRLRDGSRIQAKGITLNEGKLVIDEISGVGFPATLEEIAQVRAGSVRVQDLLDLPWQATLPEHLKTPAGVDPQAVCWTGFNQDQMLVLWPGTKVAFPLTESFRALALRLALAPGAPPNAEATLRILADGKEITRTAPLKAGEPPRFLQVPLEASKKITIIAESTVPGSRLLLIDPVAIRTP